MKNINWKYLGYICIGFAALEGYHIEESGNWWPMIVVGSLGAIFFEIAYATKKKNQRLLDS